VPELKLEGVVNNDKQVSAWLSIAPKAVTSAILKRLYKEKARFVGAKKGNKIGTYTRHVMRMNRRGRPGKMPMNVARIFSGLVKVPRGGKNVENVTLTLGMTKENHSPFVQGIIGLQSGYTRTTSSWMPIPNYSNLEKVGITGKYYMNFKTMADRGELIPLRIGGQMLFIYEPMIETGFDLYESTLFTGVKRVSVDAMDWKFKEKFDKLYPKIVLRTQRAIDRVIRGLNRGYIKAR